METVQMGPGKGKCGCGCGQLTTISRWNDLRAGVKAGEHFTYCHGHGRWRESDQERFWSKVKPAPAEVCWLWAASLNSKGYGQFSHQGQPRGAHRIAWMLLRGDIPDGLTIDHLCLLPKCVNPWHMDLVPLAENSKRVHQRGRAVLPQNPRPTVGFVRKAK